MVVTTVDVVVMAGWFGSRVCFQRGFDTVLVSVNLVLVSASSCGGSGCVVW
jgi:hypothetical protein